MTSALESSRFHLTHAWFNLKEQFSDLPSALVSNALIPFFIWILSLVWIRFNSTSSILRFEEVILYLGITEMLFMTFVRGPSISRASQDFSISLARPRSWLMTSYSGIVGRALGGRVLLLLILALTLPLLGARFEDSLHACIRLMVLLPVLSVLQGLFALFFAICQVLWHQVDYFLLPFGKIFLVLGGVWGPLSDFSEPWRGALLRLPPSDLFFQPAYYCIKGQFYGIEPLTWLLRTSALTLVLLLANLALFRVARERHQAFGG